MDANWRLVAGVLLTAVNALFLVIHSGILFFFRRELKRLDRHVRFGHGINDNFSTLHSRVALIEIRLDRRLGTA